MLQRPSIRDIYAPQRSSLQIFGHSIPNTHVHAQRAYGCGSVFSFPTSPLIFIPLTLFATLAMAPVHDALSLRHFEGEGAGFSACGCGSDCGVVSSDERRAGSGECLERLVSAAVDLFTGVVGREFWSSSMTGNISRLGLSRMLCCRDGDAVAVDVAIIVMGER